jgi:Sulfotransferase domain
VSTDAARIAMWSGPRTVSTAMMRAWENRPDTVVTDEPLYAFYLSSTGIDHPGRDEVIASQPTSWQAVLSSLADDPLPPGVAIAYAKHMTHHVLPSVDLAAFAPFRHAFLIRDPRSLLASYAKVRSAPTLADLGLRQQAWLYEEFGGPVIDSTDLLAAPEAGLRALCAALGVPFSPAMLSWPAGPRPSDGVWAPHWYDSVWRSTGFTPLPPGPPRPLDPALEPLLEECLPYYRRLSENKIKIEEPNDRTLGS